MKGKRAISILLILMLVSTYSIGERIFRREVEKKEIDTVISQEGFVERAIEKLMKMAHMSAVSAAIVKDGELVWARGFGLAYREKNMVADENTIYLVASISKTFTATAIMQLYEKGLIDIDNDVNEYLPFSLRNPRYPDEPITVRMLLAHQSSLAEDPPGFYFRCPAGLKMEDYFEQWLHEYLTPSGLYYMPQIWSDYEPGEKMFYANVGYSLLGYIVERVSGESFEEYCRKNIFEPLGMKNTSFEFENLNISRIAMPYVYSRGEYYPLTYYSILDYPAGGLRTSVVDLSRFLIAHINGGVFEGTRILKERSVEEMHRVQYPSDTYNFQYGLGFQIWDIGGERYIGHTGGLYGVATKMVFRESDGTGVIYFINSGADDLRGIVAYSLIERLLFWKASGFDASELSIDKIKATVMANLHLIGKEIDKDAIEEEINSAFSQLIIPS